jgi:hypothetical protein
MGNVLASGPPPPPPPLPPKIIVDVEEKPLENPGTVEDLHKKTKGIRVVFLCVH